MKKILLLSAFFLCTAVSSFARSYITVAYWGDASQKCWPAGNDCYHVVTFVFDMVRINDEFNNANISVPQGATMGLMTDGTQQGYYSNFDAITAPITQTDDPNALTSAYVPAQEAVWSAELNGWLVYFYQTNQ